MKTKSLSDFKNVVQLNEYFKDDLTCRKYLEKIMWNGKPVCPHCGNEEHYRFSDGRRFKCKTCKKQYTVTVGTFLESSNIPLRKWLHAIYIFTSHKKGISSHQLAKDLGLTQKSAWFMLSRIREIMMDKAPEMLSGEVEIDEVYIGGKEHNKHQSPKAKAWRERHGKLPRKGKNGFKVTENTIVLGMVQRDGKIKTTIIPDDKSENILPIIVFNVKSGSTLYTDQHSSYKSTKLMGYDHHSVSHNKREYARGQVHTASIDGYWSQLKRGIYGIYHHTSKKHLQRYCNEFAFRYNTRKLNEVERFDVAIRQAFGRLKYSNLIGKPISIKAK